MISSAAVTSAIPIPSKIGLPGQGVGLPISTPAQSFAEILGQMVEKRGITLDNFQQLNSLQHKVLSNKAVSPRDLLLLQMQMGKFNLQVELVSKLAESVSATFRRLQNG